MRGERSAERFTSRLTHGLPRHSGRPRRTSDAITLLEVVVADRERLHGGQQPQTMACYGHGHARNNGREAEVIESQKPGHASR
jgi:hypothetical protein